MPSRRGRPDEYEYRRKGTQAATKRRGGFADATDIRQSCRGSSDAASCNRAPDLDRPGRAARAGLLAPKHQERQIANQYRQIKRPLIAGALGRDRTRLPNGQLIMVASAMQGEGKTFTTINLAFSMAMEKDVHVVLVDADVAKPQISKMFGASGEAGLLNAVVDHSLRWEHLILPTDVPHLSLLPAGLRSDHATELISSERMITQMRELAERDPTLIILFDSSPLLLTTESQALAHVAGQIVVVVRAEHTQQQTLMDALSYLPRDSSVSLILNQTTSKASSSYYYGYGGATEQDPTP